MKALNYILKNSIQLDTVGDDSIDIKALQFDSRKVEQGDCFFALSGTQVDGHDYIDKAIELGAVAVVCEKLPKNKKKDVCYIQLEDTAKALGLAAAEYFDRPSSQLKLVGVTGTNGKTTTVTLLHQLFIKLGYKVGMLSTITNKINHQEIPATHTTPDPLQMQALLQQMVAEGCDYCFMEVSSHAVSQERIAGLEFAGGVFTNITQDHLDYHLTFAAYIKAKKQFFDGLSSQSFALVNVDDKNGRVMLQNTKAKQYTYALKSMADYKAKILEPHFDGMLLALNGTELWSSFIGGFNAYNLLTVYAVALLLDQDETEVLQYMSTLSAVDGRFEYLKSPNGVIAIVDYAHTPDALQNVLDTIQEIKGGNSQVISVVGAGGNRDKTKRPLMARVAAEMSDRVILTSDNPRNEDPDEIIKDMKAGVLPPLSAKVLSITDRTEAIKTACALAQPGDLVLVAGKGHETYQEIKGERYYFDDKKVLSEIFKTS